jgi:hypothetical protein
MDKLKLLYTASSAEELQFIIDSLCNKQRDLLINLLREEKETLEPHTESNLWAKDRVQLVDSILSSLGVNVDVDSLDID